MKTYIGTKNVQAEPMNEFDAVEKGNNAVITGGRIVPPTIKTTKWKNGFVSPLLHVQPYVQYTMC